MFPAFKSAPEASLDVFSTFGSVPEASLDAFSAFGRPPETSPAYFQPSKVLPRLSSQCCALLTEFSSKTRALFLSQGVALRQKHFQFGSNKNHHKLRSFYET